MTTNGRTTAVGVFTDHALAEQALERLHNAGFTSDQLGFVSRGGNVARDNVLSGDTEETSVPGAAAGAVGGGVIGGVIGAAVSLLIPGLGPALAGGILAATLGGAAIGAVAGGFAGSLMHVGVPEEEATYYQSELEAGRTIVMVNAPGRYDEAISILRQSGATDATVRSDMPDTNAAASMSGLVGPDTGSPLIPPAVFPAAAAGTAGLGGGAIGTGVPYGAAAVVPPAAAAMAANPDVDQTVGTGVPEAAADPTPQSYGTQQGYSATVNREERVETHDPNLRSTTGDAGINTVPPASNELETRRERQEELRPESNPDLPTEPRI